MDCSINADLSVKKIFNSTLYQLGEKIGEGGFGQVYKAIQNSTKKIVAIKFLTLNADFDAEKKRRYIERFHRESDLIRRLNHPNIVQLIDKGQQSDALLYAVYEYIDGHSLKEQLDSQGPLSATDAADVMACVLDALSHAHEQGVIHRDIKPANIMLYQVGAKTQVKVLDFGIGTLKSEARQLDYKSITLTQETLGTPSYSAPEQLRGEPPVAQTDIYVWGLVFLECLTGTPTITGSNLAAIFHQQLSPANVPLTILAGHSSANFFRRVLNKNPHKRPSNTAELYHDFRQLNFSNLVGDLSALPSFIHQNRPAYAISASEHDETLVHEGRLFDSRLTERKQISVLSVILTTTALDTELHQAQHNDQDVIDTFHADQIQQCIDIAIRYGAYHVGSVADTVLFYFGYPQVTDNDSRLCSRAALDIASNVNKKNALLKNSQGINTHIQMGMHIGLMLSLANNVPEGKAANDAMGLCRQAKPGQIICSEKVKHLLSSYLIFDANNYPVENSPRSQALFSLRGERELEAFGFLRSTRKNRAFIGREQELTQLKNCLTATHTKLAHIHGEAGIGKSRLVFELRNTNQHLRHFVAQCLPEHQNNALYPILNLVKFKFSLDVLSTNNSVQRLKNALLATKLNQEEQALGLLVLSAWLNYPLPEVNPAANLSPEKQKQHLFLAISQLLCLTNLNSANNYNADAATNSKQQYLFIFEDLHWADPTSKDFISSLVQCKVFKQAGHSWCNTSRQALPNELTELQFQLVPVSKLAENSSIEFINSLFDHQPLAENLLTILVERSDGIPLFIEELASTLQKDKLVHKVNGIFAFINSDSQAQIPASLRESLQQKLDRLPHGKETAQLAATIGREFDYDLLVAASEKDESQVQYDLEQLISAELVYLQRKVAGDSYIFKHALVRDAAYDSIVLPEKKLKHMNIAKTLKLCPLISLENKSLIYYHLKEAQLFSPAFKQGCEVLTIKQKFNDYEELTLLSNSLFQLNENINDKVQRIENIIKLNELVFKIEVYQKGYVSEKLQKLSQESICLIENSGQKSAFLVNELNTANLFLMTYYHMKSYRKKAMEYCLKLETSNKIAGINKKALYAMKTKMALLDGNVNLAGQSLILAKQSAIDLSNVNNLGIDDEALIHMYASLYNSFVLKEDAAFSEIEKAITISKEKNELNSLFFSYAYAVACCVFFQKRETARKYIVALEKELTQVLGFDHFRFFLSGFKAWTDNKPEPLKAIVYLADIKEGINYSLWTSMYIDTLMKNGSVELVAKHINDFISQCQHNKEVYMLPQLLSFSQQVTPLCGEIKIQIDSIKKMCIDNGNLWGTRVLSHV